MGRFTRGKPQQAAGAVRPGTGPPMASGRRLRSHLSPADWIAPSFLEAVTSGKVESRDFKEAASR